MKLFFHIILIVLMCTSGAAGQETVFALLKNDLELADQYFEQRNYSKALALYLTVSKKNPSQSVDLKIARAHLHLKQYSQASEVYGRHAQALTVPDLFDYAEAQSGIPDYEKAIEVYQRYLVRVPDDPLVMKKIWRLNNVQFLFEDSSHYAVKPLNLNTVYGELCAIPYKDGLVFISNRKEIQPIEKLDGSQRTPFYKMYFSKIVQDTIAYGSFQYESPETFNIRHHALHAGPFAFYNKSQKLVFASTGTKSAKNGIRTLQLYFAELKGTNWKITAGFPYNSDHFSLSDPTISDDGKTLYFSSDMKGGAGGKDLYKSEFIGNQWTKPVNLGEGINTPYDEVFPFLHNDVLYFSSNGQAGLGGLDIFKAELRGNEFDEPQNLGYPLNSNYDDFGIVIDSLNAHGYFSSNRNTGGFNDDIFEFDMDLQTYPMQIDGVVQFKEHSWSDSSDLKIMPHAKVFLIDHKRNVTVLESTCDSSGKFSIMVPYYSQYKIKVVGEDHEENVVSLELPKHKRINYEHEIVIVKDAFKSN